MSRLPILRLRPSVARCYAGETERTGLWEEVYCPIIESAIRAEQVASTTMRRTRRFWFPVSVGSFA